MLSGVYKEHKKDGTPYYRASIHYKNKHISLGSYSTEDDANSAYLEAGRLLNSVKTPFEQAILEDMVLDFHKVVVLCNFRDNGMYIKTPIYLRANYFSYYFSPTEEYKFDIDDLFFYSQHKIIKRGGHYFVSEYGMQTSIYSRYGIRAHSVLGKDYDFANGDVTDWRYSNIIVTNPYHGVRQMYRNGIPKYKAKIHIKGSFTIGVYSTPEKAAIAYNKAIDIAKDAGIDRNYPENYIETLSPRDYANIYTQLKMPQRFTEYLETFYQGK